MANKIITLDQHFSTGEPTVQLVSTWGNSGRVLREATSLDKVAAVKSPALDYIKNVDPEPGKSTVLIIGLGDHETYGPNRNGDGFPSEPVPGKIASDQVLTKHYQTYKNAHVFRHHANTDPKKAIGRVKMAFWNPHMRRVEVIEDFVHDKAPDLLEKIADGEYPAKSMGCRIKYDVCTECGNRARTRAEYCDHLKYEMGKINATTGKQAAALNPSPNFFDSSWVIRPADRTGYMLKKVAYDSPYEIRGSYELAEIIDDLKEKSAELGKAADIEKILNGKAEASASNLDDSDVKLLKRYKEDMLPSAMEGTKPLKMRAIQIIIKHPPGEALKTTEDMGMPLGIGELLKYFLGRMSPDVECGEEATKAASMHVPLILETLAAYPRFCDDLIKVSQLNEGEFSQKLAQGLQPYGPDRITSGDYMSRRFTPDAFRGREPARTDVFSYTDPVTGQGYKTNRGAVEQTHDALTERAYKTKAMKATPLLGTSALLGATALGLGRFGGKAQRLKALTAGAGSAATGAYGVHQITKPTTLGGPVVQTNQGTPISGWTEMVRTAGDTAPELSYMLRRAIDGPSIALPRKYAEKLSESIKSAEVYDELAPVLGPTLDLDQVARTIGDSIVAWMP